MYSYLIASHKIISRTLTSSAATTLFLAMIHADQPIVIVGAGCFGLSTAYHLLKRGYVDVTVLDRSFDLPAPDAASNDLNRSTGKDF